MTRRRTSSSSHGNPASSSASRRSSRPGRSKRAETSASDSPDRTAIGSDFSPRARRIASTRIDLPAPVSPVTTFRPGPKGTRTSSKMARFRTESSISIARKESPLTPLELGAQDAEVVLEGRPEEAERGIRLLHLDHIPPAQAEPDLAVEGQENVGLLRPELGPDLHIVRDDEGPVGERMGADRRDDDRPQRGVDDGPLGREVVPGRA